MYSIHRWVTAEKDHPRLWFASCRNIVSDCFMIRTCLICLNFPTFVRNIPAFNAHQADDLESPSNSDCHGDTVQLLTAEGTVGMRCGGIGDFKDRQLLQPRPSQGTLRPNHSSIWWYWLHPLAQCVINALHRITSWSTELTDETLTLANAATKRL